VLTLQHQLQSDANKQCVEQLQRDQQAYTAATSQHLEALLQATTLNGTPSHTCACTPGLLSCCDLTFECVLHVALSSLSSKAHATQHSIEHQLETAHNTLKQLIDKAAHRFRSVQSVFTVSLGPAGGTAQGTAGR